MCLCVCEIYLGYKIKTIYTFINEIDANPLAIDARNIMLVIAFPQNEVFKWIIAFFYLFIIVWVDSYKKDVHKRFAGLKLDIQ